MVVKVYIQTSDQYCIVIEMDDAVYELLHLVHCAIHTTSEKSCYVNTACITPNLANRSERIFNIAVCVVMCFILTWVNSISNLGAKCTNIGHSKRPIII